ncbi:MAG: protease modulator HflC [Verrucomicrobiae bacterium]|nr:protease modulator HflC [Verrucomicrobiae bacterium]
MKTSRINLVIGSLLLALFVLLLFLFQVRQTEVAVVTTFGKATRPITDPGLYLKLPWPIQKVTKLDKRLQAFEGKFEETLTGDNRNLLILVFAGWRIGDPALFYTRFAEGSLAEAERSLENILRTAKNAAVGRHSFARFISVNPDDLRFDQIEAEILAAVRKDAEPQGIEVEIARIKRIGLPESVTEKVFDRMRAERTKEVERLKAEGEEEAIKIRSAADLERDKLLAQADAQATRIRGEGEAEAARSFSVFQQNPNLAILFLKLNSLEATLKERATLVVDPRTPPFDLLLNPQQPDEVQPPFAVRTSP